MRSIFFPQSPRVFLVRALLLHSHCPAKNRPSFRRQRTYSPWGSSDLTIKTWPSRIGGLSWQSSSMWSRWILPPTVANFGSSKTSSRFVVVSSSCGFKITVKPPSGFSRIWSTVVSKLGIIKFRSVNEVRGLEHLWIDCFF